MRQRTRRRFPTEGGETSAAPFRRRVSQADSRVFVTIGFWRGGKSLYNIKDPRVLDTKIPAKADKNGIYEWTWAPEDDVAYSFGARL